MTELNIRKEGFLNALLGSLTVDEACKKSNITRPTEYKYLKDPVFLEKYRSLRRDAMQQVTTQLQQATVEAVDVLKEVMNNTEAPAAPRVSSVKNVLDVAYRAFELDDLAEEVEKIKEQLEDT